MLVGKLEAEYTCTVKIDDKKVYVLFIRRTNLSEHDPAFYRLKK